MILHEEHICPLVPICDATMEMKRYLTVKLVIS